MNKIRFYQIIIIALIILNIVLLFLHFSRPSKPNGPKKIIIEKLHFDKAQLAQYEAIIKEHQISVLENEAKVKKLKVELYKQLLNVDNNLKVDSLTTKIAELQKRAEIINFNHFKDIKKICIATQLPYFEKLTIELAELFSRKKPGLQK